MILAFTVAADDGAASQLEPHAFPQLRSCVCTFTTGHVYSMGNITQLLHNTDTSRNTNEILKHKKN